VVIGEQDTPVGPFDSAVRDDIHIDGRADGLHREGVRGTSRGQASGQPFEGRPVGDSDGDVHVPGGSSGEPIEQGDGEDVARRRTDHHVLGADRLGGGVEHGQDLGGGVEVRIGRGT
jgi:hypothetical protein